MIRICFVGSVIDDCNVPSLRLQEIGRGGILVIEEPVWLNILARAPILSGVPVLSMLAFSIGLGVNVVG